MSEVRIELGHTMTVVRQSQDETWSYETRARQDMNMSRLEPRQDMDAWRLSRAEMCKYVSQDYHCATTTQLIVTNFNDKLSQRPLKKPFDHDTLRLGYR